MQLSDGLETAGAGTASVIGFCLARNGGTPGENPSLMRATDDRILAGDQRVHGDTAEHGDA